MISVKLSPQYFDEIFDEKASSKQLRYDQVHNFDQEVVTVWLESPSCPVQAEQSLC